MSRFVNALTRRKPESGRLMYQPKKSSPPGQPSSRAARRASRALEKKGPFTHLYLRVLARWNRSLNFVSPLAPHSLAKLTSCENGVKK
jgi:hypothetical protein